VICCVGGRDFHERLVNEEAEGLDQTWHYRLGLMSTTKHKMLSRSMSYTSALVEALADKLLQREDKLKKLTNLQPNIDLVEALVRFLKHPACLACTK
jgi:hypothetical protein